MVLITKEEKEAIREKFPKIGIVRTMRQKSSRHRYYCEESPKAMQYLATIRNRNVLEEHTDTPRRTKKDGKDVRHAAGTKRARV
jgi:hypothetical protein